MQHPGIFMSAVKETDFFTYDVDRSTDDAFGFTLPGDRAWIRRQSAGRRVDGLASYAALFDNAATSQLRGEVSPSYLYSPLAPKRIRHHMPDARLVAVLRQPVERAYSAFVQDQRSGNESEALLSDAFEQEWASVANGAGGFRHELRVGLYHEQLQRYIGLFPRENIRIFLYDELSSAPGVFLHELFRFLGVDTSFRPDTSTTYNASGSPRSVLLERLLRGQGTLKSAVRRTMPGTFVGRLASLQNRIGERNLVKSSLSDSERRALTDRYYRKDILRTQDLIGMDLTHWLR